MRRALSIAAVLTLSLSACGTAASTQNSKFKGEQQNVVKVVDSLAQAGTRGDADKICTEILAKQLVTELKTAGGDCVTEMDRAIKDASDYDLQVTRVTINGANATAQVRQGKDGQVETFSLLLGGGGWRAPPLGS
jgi:hypothetical protein